MFRVTTLEPLQSNRSFEEDFFGKMVALTVSGQLSAETFAMAFKSVYTFGPTFRAENSNTTRHAAEFWMIEPEVAFANLKDNMDLSEAMIKYIINYVMQEAKEEMEFFNKFVDSNIFTRLSNITDSVFQRIDYTDAIDILKESKHNFKYQVTWGMDLQTEHERYLTDKVYNKPVFVMNYPKHIKAFYMRLNDDSKTVAAMDLLVPGIGEIIGGSQREERLSVLEKRMQECGLNKEDYEWYLDTRRYGSVIHSGYGLGLERFIMYITGIANIRDVIAYPRTAGNCLY
jgi:asparaginyl-tRNA synthetase